MLSSASKNAIRAILYLAKNSDQQNKINVKSIAEDLEYPQPFLAKLLRQLSSNKLVTSVKGPNGGFYLNKKNKKNYLWDVIVCIDGGYKFDNCFLGLSKCDHKNPCPVHDTVTPFKENILKIFKEKNIHELIKEIDDNNTLISLKGIDL